MGQGVKGYVRLAEEALGTLTDSNLKEKVSNFKAPLVTTIGKATGICYGMELKT